MLYDLPLCILALLAVHISAADAIPSISDGLSSLASKFPSFRHEKRVNNLDVNPNGSTFLWLPEDEYSGSTFFDGFTFWSDVDPTHGLVTYVNSSTAWETGLVYIQDNDKIIMKGDNTTWLPDNVNRSSVRIQSNKLYNTGLFILDLDKAPWGCGVWPAFWTVGTNWPTNGEIDILEGVHDNAHNQVTWHTREGCYLNPNASFTGTVVTTNGANNTVCDGNINSNAGCGITEWSRASYGEDFDRQGGGVYAMKWDENGISIWSFYRAAIPQDIIAGSPNPSTWTTPVATLTPNSCDPLDYFANHTIVFDITFCGDWAGNSYATTTCPGTCPEHLKDPSNFVNATWIINSLKVYRKQLLLGGVSSSSSKALESPLLFWWTALASTALALVIL